MVATTSSNASEGAALLDMDRVRGSEQVVEGLKCEIRDLKNAICEGRIKLASPSLDAEERQWIKEEQRWLWEETRLLREEVRLRLEWRNGVMFQQQQQPLCTATTPNGAAASPWKMPVRADATGWVFPEFVPPWPPAMPQQQQQPLQQQRADMGEVSSWMCQPQQQPQPRPQQQRPRLLPLRPRKEISGVTSLAEAQTDPVPMQPTKGTKRRRNPASAVKEEQENREERGKRPRWKDHWVMNLIHVRGSMQDEFSKPPKQGVDLWRQVYNKLVAVCPDFDKEPEACRKKWKMIVTDYKAAYSGSAGGAERPEKCRWYQMIDEYINTKDGASVGFEEVDETQKNDVQPKMDDDPRSYLEDSSAVKQ